MATTLTPKELALAWETDARTVRKFLRSDGGTGKVGQGNRHAIPAGSVKKLAKAFADWDAARRAKAATEQVPSEIAEDETLDLITE